LGYDHQIEVVGHKTSDALYEELMKKLVEEAKAANPEKYEDFICPRIIKSDE